MERILQVKCECKNMNNKYPPGVSEEDIDAQFGDEPKVEEELTYTDKIKRNPMKTTIDLNEQQREFLILKLVYIESSNEYDNFHKIISRQIINKLIEE